jgi:hypothetical protein
LAGTDGKVPVGGYIDNSCIQANAETMPLVKHVESPKKLPNMLRCHKDLQQWNPSGGYCVTILYHHGKQRELKPDELLKIAVGIDVAGCRVTEGIRQQWE